MSAYASPATPAANGGWTTIDPPTKYDPLSAPGAAVTRDPNGMITNVDLDGADAWQQRENQRIAQTGFDDARAWAAQWQD